MQHLIERFEEMLIADRNLALQTVSAYRSDIKKFLKVFGDIHVKKEDIENYIAMLKESNVKQSSILRNIASLRNFFSFLYEEKLIAGNPMLNIKSKNKNKPLPKTLSKEEVISLLSRFNFKENLKLKTMFHILYGAGLRVSELVELTLDSIVKNDEMNRITLIVKGKGGSERMLPLNEIAVRSILEYIKSGYIKSGNNFLFQSRSKAGHITRQGFAKLLKNLAIESGVSPSKVSPHVIRHAFATHLLSNGADILTIQKLLGHKDVSTTQIYTHVSNEKIQKMVESNPNLEKIEALKKCKRK